jgi:hypothetical protein
MEPGQPRRRGRKPKESPATEELPALKIARAEPAPGEERSSETRGLAAQPPDLAAAEAELARKYPHVAIKPGSLRLGAAEGWGTKRIVTIVCTACQVNERLVATSDLFHVSTCPQCSKAAKKAARKAKQQSKPN